MISWASAVCEASPRCESRWRHRKRMSLPRPVRNSFSSLSRKDAMVVSAFHTALARIHHAAKLSNPKCPSIRQPFIPGFLCERNNQQPNPKGDSCVRHGFPDCSDMTDHRADQKIHTRANKPSERSRKRKRGCANGSIVLFWKPKTEQREVSPEKSQEKQAGYEGLKRFSLKKNHTKHKKKKKL